MMRLAIAAFTLSFFALTTFAEERCTPIVILGTYHFAQQESDDITSAKRQEEVAEVVERLAKFKPTKVLIESAHWSPQWNERYEQWRAGKYEMGKNEIEQLGFRVAAKMNHARLWPVDYPMLMTGLTPQEQRAPKTKPAPKAASGPVDPVIAARRAKLATSTVSEYLTFLNQPEQFRQNHQWDVIENLTPGAGLSLYQKTDLATNWYKRNLRIFTNVIEITEPEDRLLLIIGAGHLKILRELAEDHPGYCLEEF